MDIIIRGRGDDGALPASIRPVSSLVILRCSCCWSRDAPRVIVRRRHNRCIIRIHYRVGYKKDWSPPNALSDHYCCCCVASWQLFWSKCTLILYWTRLSLRVQTQGVDCNNCNESDQCRNITNSTPIQKFVFFRLVVFHIGKSAKNGLGYQAYRVIVEKKKFVQESDWKDWKERHLDYNEPSVHEGDR